jgi:hypothetical protein
MASEDEHRAGDHPEVAGNERLADQDRDPAGADRDPAGAERVTLLERRARRLLHVYPAVYRRERGEEIIGTLLDASDNRNWPRLRDVRALVVGGLKARAAQNRQRTVGANLRVAVMTGLAMYVSLCVAVYVANLALGLMISSQRFPGWTSWPAALIAGLAGATIALAWTAPRYIVVAGALAASAAVVFYAPADGELLGSRLLQVLALAGLAAVAPRTGHPSRRWLWLPGLIVVSWTLFQLSVGAWFMPTWGLFAPGLPLLAFAVAGVLWMAIDARLMIAVLTYLALIMLQAPVTDPWGLAAPTSLPFLGVIIALAASAAWLLRRQSGHAVR